MTINVKLLASTPNPEQIVACAAKLCYSKSDVESLFEKQTKEVSNQFIEKLMSTGHESPLEHISFTFAIEGVSRALTHQLVRHRIASPSQQSQRYVDLSEVFEYITPKIIYDMDTYYETESFREEFRGDMQDIQKMYVKWQKAIQHFVEESKYHTNGMTAEKVANENARAVLPNACETKLIFTINARSLLNFFKHRCCRRAQEEINELAWLMLRLVQKEAPTIFKNAGPSCQVTKCSEGAMTCKRPYDKINK